MISYLIILISAILNVWLMPLEQNPKLFEGDMMFNENNLRTLSLKGGNKWPNGILPWRADNGIFSEIELKTINDAFIDIESKVNTADKKHIQIVSWTNQENWVQIVKDTGCYSYVGLINRGAQNLSLGTGCINSGIIQHELLHALGFFHEQSRPDRDDYVIVNLTNIVSGMEHNFEKYTTNVDFYGLPYDYDSIMHYGAYYFSKNKLPTIIPKNQSVAIGNREKMSDYDIQTVRLHYPSKDSTTRITSVTNSMNESLTKTIITTTSRITNTTSSILILNTTNTRFTTKTRRIRQKNIIKASLKIIVDFYKFEYNYQYKINLTNIIKAKIIKHLKSIFKDFYDILEFNLMRIPGRKRQLQITVIDQYTFVLDTALQRDVKKEVRMVSSQVASDLNGTLDILASSDVKIESLMESNKSSMIRLSQILIYTLLSILFFNFKFYF